MAEEDFEQLVAKARVFFDQAQKVTGTGNYDYAIEMYLEGLRCVPDALIEGHTKLHELGLLRRMKGGEKPSMMERIKGVHGRSPLEQMLCAEHLFAKDPEHLPYAEAILKAAIAGDYRRTAKWIADLIFEANNAAKRRSVAVYLTLKDAYAAIGLFERALSACQFASRLKPEDKELVDEGRRLAAEMTVAKGKYDRTGDFRESIQGIHKQQMMQAQDDVIKTEDYRTAAVKDASDAMKQGPDIPINIFNLAKALEDMQDDKSCDEAIALLEDAYGKSADFSFKRQAGQIGIRRLQRKIRKAEALLAANPKDGELESRLEKMWAERDSTELEHYRLCVENYPTDLHAKYDYGVCLMRSMRYDEAIPLLQQAQHDPRRKIASMNKIGLCFLEKKWISDAIDVFEQAIEQYEIKDDGISKELCYNLGRCYEQQGDIKRAIEIYRKVAQIDFGFKDVSRRVDNLRNGQNRPTSQ